MKNNYSETGTYRRSTLATLAVLFFSPVLLILFNNCTPGFISSADITQASSINPDGNPSADSPADDQMSEALSGTSPAVPMVACSSTQFEFPMPTHWSNVKGGFSEGATDIPTIYNPAPPQEKKPIYNYGWFPVFNKYIADRFEIDRISDTEFKTWSMDICASTGVAVELRRPTSFVDWTVARQKPIEGRGSIQIVHALLSDNNLVSIYLPPNWSKRDAAGKYPILFNGFYDLKVGLFSEGTLITKAMAKAWTTSRVPFIGVSWNGSGAIGSRTLNPAARAAFNKIIQDIAKQFGGDSQRIMTFGGSRGAMTSLAMASNPEKYPYKVIAAYAASPATDLNGAATLTGSTVPFLLNAAEWSLGYSDAWKKGFIYPANGMGMDGFTRNDAHLFILGGSRAPADFDSRLSLSSTAMINGLRDMGTQVFFESGSHDIICPWVDQFRYMKKLAAAGVKTETRVNYLYGHSQSGAITTPENFSRIMIKIAKKDFAGIFQSGKKTFFRNDYLTKTIANVASEKFTFELPRYQSPSVDGHIVMTGIPDTDVEYGGKLNNSDYAVQTAKLGADGTFLINLSPLLPGNYTVTYVRIRKPGQSVWKNIDLNQSTTALNRGTLNLEVLAADPGNESSSSEVGSYIRGGYLGGDLSSAVNGMISVSYGVVELD